MNFGQVSENGNFIPWVANDESQLRQYALKVMNTNNYYNTQSDRLAFANWFASNGNDGSILQNLSPLEATILENIYAIALLDNQDNIPGVIVEWLGKDNNVDTIQKSLPPPPPPPTPVQPLPLGQFDLNIPLPQFGEQTNDTQDENLPPR